MTLVDLVELKRRGAALKRVREACYLTQDQLAEELGVSKQSVSNWETGQHISYDRARAFVDVCHATGLLMDSANHVVQYIFGEVESFHSKVGQPSVMGDGGNEQAKQGSTMLPWAS